jgi:hypothetical protein
LRGNLSVPKLSTSQDGNMSSYVGLCGEGVHCSLWHFLRFFLLFFNNEFWWRRGLRGA